MKTSYDAHRDDYMNLYVQLRRYTNLSLTLILYLNLLSSI